MQRGKELGVRNRLSGLGLVDAVEAGQLHAAAADIAHIEQHIVDGRHFGANIPLLLIGILEVQRHERSARRRLGGRLIEYRLDGGIARVDDDLGDAERWIQPGIQLRVQQ